MILDKAIQILALSKKCEFDGSSRELEEAHQLGIEALKRIQFLKHRAGYHVGGLLPGETEE